MRRTYQVLALTLISLSATAAWAQSNHSQVPSVSFPYAPPEAIHRHSSTAAEGYLRGEAVHIQAQGNFLLLDAQAHILHRQSESMSYDNAIKKTRTALLRKQILKDYRDTERTEKRARREAGRESIYHQQVEMAGNHRLDQFQFNQRTGTIYWPTYVASPRYAAHRYELERLMHYMVHYGTNGGQVREEAARLADQFREQLRNDFLARTDRNALSVRQEYHDTRRFLLGLKFAPLQTDATNS